MQRNALASASAPSSPMLLSVIPFNSIQCSALNAHKYRLLIQLYHATQHTHSHEALSDWTFT